MPLVEPIRPTFRSLDERIVDAAFGRNQHERGPHPFAVPEPPVPRDTPAPRPPLPEYSGTVIDRPPPLPGPLAGERPFLSNISPDTVIEARQPFGGSRDYVPLFVFR